MSGNNFFLENLNEPQKEAVLTTEGPLLILAGAGSGKTRTIVHRLAWLIHEKKVFPSRIIAVTFTNKAAHEMQSRALELAGSEASQSLIRTYHSLGLTFLRKYSRYLGLPDSFTIWDDEDQRSVISSILSNDYKDRFNRNQIRYFVQTISSLKDELISPEDFLEEVDSEEMEFGDILPQVYQKYEDFKEASFAVDFSDLIYLPVQIFQSYPDVLQEVHERYRYFLVDEYQDTNTAQYTLISLLSQQSKNLCVVGDDDQAIYGWRGANVKNILDFHRDFPEAKIIKLEENYRSTQSILDLSNAVIQNNEDRMEKTLWTAQPGGELPRLFVLHDDQQEAKAIAQLIQSLSKQVALEDIAVLYRTNSQSRLIEEAFLSNEIPYQIFGGVSFFARKEVKDALSYLKFLVNPFDEITFARMINTPTRGIGEKSIQKLVALRDQLEQQTKTAVSFLQIIEPAKQVLAGKAVASFATIMELLQSSVSRAVSGDLGLLFEDVLTQAGLFELYKEEDRLLGSQRMENLTELKNSILRFQTRNPDVGLKEYIQEISLFSQVTELEQERRVNLMTVHNAKGLEFSYVFLVGLDDDIFPHYLAKQEGDISEERRLFYVASTRAKKVLYFFRSQRRVFQGFYRNTSPSIFLSEIPDNMCETIFQTKETQNLKRKTQVYSNIAKNPKTENSFKAGDKVVHPTFGAGRILKLEGRGDATKVFILFDDKKSRKFVLRFTQLEKI